MKGPIFDKPISVRCPRDTGRVYTVFIHGVKHLMVKSLVFQTAVTSPAVLLSVKNVIDNFQNCSILAQSFQSLSLSRNHMACFSYDEADAVVLDIFPS